TRRAPWFRRIQRRLRAGFHLQAAQRSNAPRGGGGDSGDAAHGAVAVADARGRSGAGCRATPRCETDVGGSHPELVERRYLDALDQALELRALRLLQEVRPW